MIIPEVSEALNLSWFLHSMWVVPGTVFVVWFVKRYSQFNRHLLAIDNSHAFPKFFEETAQLFILPIAKKITSYLKVFN